jgi:hypothetical protein
MPRVVSLDEIRGGALLAVDVLDARGHVLLSAGASLTGAHVSLLRRRGIESVTVRSEEDRAGGDSAPDPARVAQVLEQLDRNFTGLEDNAIMSAVHRAARAHLEAGNLPPS